MCGWSSQWRPATTRLRRICTGGACRRSWQAPPSCPRSCGESTRPRRLLRPAPCGRPPWARRSRRSRRWSRHRSGRLTRSLPGVSSAEYDSRSSSAGTTAGAVADAFARSARRRAVGGHSPSSALTTHAASARSVYLPLPGRSRACLSPRRRHRPRRCGARRRRQPRQRQTARVAVGRTAQARCKRDERHAVVPVRQGRWSADELHAQLRQWVCT
mmetsp:Transcript_14100/g.49644  ORF Transcript_14100/g.49644 Transcript_14100/m.49644 type:complete len:215 (+) Transcript_14100:407-1051(+)